VWDTSLFVWDTSLFVWDTSLFVWDTSLFVWTPHGIRVSYPMGRGQRVISRGHLGQDDESRTMYASHELHACKLHNKSGHLGQDDESRTM